jgi:hypothetical protein
MAVNMNKAVLLTLMAGASLAAPLRADLRIQVKETYAGGSANRVEYYKGNCARSESDQGGGYVIVDRINKRTIMVDPAKREYSIFTHTERTIDPSSTIVVDVETRDTGERRQMFGHTVLHLITTERQHTEYPGKPSSETHEITTDGWYLDIALSFPNHSRIGAVAVLSGPHSGVPKIRVTRRGPVPHGLAVWEKNGDDLREVTEFSEAPLDPALFETPADFRRVIHPLPGQQLSWLDQFLFGWQQFTEWLASL